MVPLPRVAVGPVEPQADCRAILWGLMEALRTYGLQVQSFLSQACFASYHAAATGLNPRHLDTWLMSPDLCREIFLRGTESCDLALVAGTFAGGLAEQNGAGGSFDALCHWLDLPRVVVLDVSGIDDRRLPQRPGQADALLLDGVHDSRHLARLEAALEARWAVPVLGALGRVPELRAEVRAVPAGTRPPRELCQRLGSHFLRHTQPQKVLELAFRRGVAWALPRGIPSGPPRGSVRLALAYDGAFDCYFADALDLLEAQGATILDFSPLRDERLPPGTDVVYLGCGHPERHAAELSQNHCMKLALWSHLRGGGRMYAEGAGLAYLCQHIELGQGGSWSMVGIFPAVARLDQAGKPPTPVEITLDRATWLGRPGTRLRGYRNRAWQLEPVGPLAGCVAEPGHGYDLVSSCQAIGSRLHLDLAAQPHLLPGFFRPDLLGRGWADPWTAGP